MNNRPNMSDAEVIVDLKQHFQKMVYGQYRIATRPIKYSYDANQNLVIDGIYHNIENQNSGDDKYTKNGTCYNLCYLWHKKCKKKYPQYHWYLVMCTENISNLDSNRGKLVYSKEMNDQMLDMYFSPDSIIADPSFGLVSKLDEALDGVDDEGFEVKYFLSETRYRPKENPIFHDKLVLQLGCQTPIGFLDKSKNQLMHICNDGPNRPVTFVVQTKGQSSNTYDWEDLEFQKMSLAHPIWKNLRHGLARNFNLKNSDEMDTSES